MKSGNRNGPPKVAVSLQCMVCGAPNYKAKRARRENAGPLVLSKYCKHCGQHTEHREAK